MISTKFEFLFLCLVFLIINGEKRNEESLYLTKFWLYICQRIVTIHQLNVDYMRPEGELRL